MWLAPLPKFQFSRGVILSICRNGYDLRQFIKRLPRKPWTQRGITKNNKNSAI
jgi:hypothetical protein